MSIVTASRPTSTTRPVTPSPCFGCFRLRSKRSPKSSSAPISRSGCFVVSGIKALPPVGGILCETRANRHCILPSPGGFKSEDKSFSRGWIPRTTLRRRLEILAAPPIARHVRSGPSVLLAPALARARRTTPRPRSSRAQRSAAGYPADDQALAAPPGRPRSGRAAALADDPLHRLDDLLEGEGGRVEDDGVGGRPQRRVRAPSVAPVALRE